MSVAAAFRTEHVAEAPRGWRVKTIVPGPQSKHEVRIAFPPGPRRKGSGRVVEILHPENERNPKCEISKKARANPGELLIFGNPDSHRISWSDEMVRRLVKAFEGWRRAGMSQKEALGRTLRETTAGKGAISEFKKRVGVNPTKGFGNHRAGCGCKFCDRAAKLQSGELKPPPLPKRRNSKKLEAQRGARERAERIRAARVNPELVDAIRAGSKVTIVNRFGQERTGRAVMRSSSGGWVLNMGGKHGTPGLADSSNVVKVRNGNPSAHDVAWQHQKKVLAMIRKMPKPIREVFDPRRASPRRRRADRNPGDTSQTREAVRLFQGFHGHDPKAIAEKHVSAAVRLDYAAIGDLLYVKTLTPLEEEAEFTFDGDGVKLASSPDGKQLYCIGGNQNILPLLEERSTEKDFIDMGDCLEVAYLARKVHGDFRPVEYYHEFGEINGMRPRLMFDKVRKQLFFIGGDYFIDVTMRAPGTPLGKVSPGIEN